MSLNRFNPRMPQLAPARINRARNERHFDEISNTRRDNNARERARLIVPVLLVALLYVGLRIALTYALTAH